MNYRSKSTGLKTESAIVTNHPEQMTAIEIITDGTNDVQVTVYDNDAEASGTILFRGTIKGSANFGGAEWTRPVIAQKGIYVAMTGTGGSYIVYTEY